MIGIEARHEHYTMKLVSDSVPAIYLLKVVHRKKQCPSPFVHALRANAFNFIFKNKWLSDVGHEK